MKKSLKMGDFRAFLGVFCLFLGSFAWFSPKCYTTGNTPLLHDKKIKYIKEFLAGVTNCITPKVFSAKKGEFYDQQ